MSGARIRFTRPPASRTTPSSEGVALAALLSFAFVITLAFASVPSRQPEAGAEPVAADCPDVTLAPASVVIGLSVERRRVAVASPTCPPDSWSLSWALAVADAASADPTVEVDPGALANADAGTGAATLDLHLADGSTAEVAVPVRLRRRTTFTRPVARRAAGAVGRVEIAAGLGRADWDLDRYRGFGGAHVWVLFRPEGAGTFTRYARAVSGPDGRVQVSVPAGPGGWRLEYPGSAVSGPATSQVVPVTG